MLAPCQHAPTLQLQNSVDAALAAQGAHLLSDSSSSFSASVWNLLSHRYSEVLMGLKGSKSMLTFRSLPSSVNTVPVYTTRPFGGTCTLQGSGLSTLYPQRMLPTCRCWLAVHPLCSQASACRGAPDASQSQMLQL